MAMFSAHRVNVSRRSQASFTSRTGKTPALSALGFSAGNSGERWRKSTRCPGQTAWPPRSVPSAAPRTPLSGQRSLPAAARSAAAPAAAAPPAPGTWSIHQGSSLLHLLLPCGRKGHLNTQSVRKDFRQHLQELVDVDHMYLLCVASAPLSVLFWKKCQKGGEDNG